MAVLSPDKHRALLACRRPDPPLTAASAAADKATREALLALQNDPALRASLDAQAAFDREIAARVHAVPLPGDFDAQLHAGCERARLHRSSGRGMMRHPAFWAVLLATAFLLAWGGYAVWDHLRGFAGEDAVGRLVENVSANAGSQQLEPLAVECANLGDALSLKGLDDFATPERFARYETVGYRVFDHNSFPVVQVKVREHDMTFLIFRADQQGVSIAPPGRWKFVEGERWAAAAQVRDNICFVVAGHGDKAQISGYLQEAKQADQARRKQQATAAAASPAPAP